MDILIKNIGGLPKDGDLTLTITPKGEITLGGCIFTHNFGKEVKAIELPPHGDLINKQETVKKLMDVMCEGCHHFDDCSWCSMAEYRRIVEDAPTVIEASKERE